MLPSEENPLTGPLLALFRVTVKFDAFQKASGALKVKLTVKKPYCTSVCTMLMRRDRKALTQL